MASSRSISFSVLLFEKYACMVYSFGKSYRSLSSARCVKSDCELSGLRYAPLHVKLTSATLNQSDSKSLKLYENRFEPASLKTPSSPDGSTTVGTSLNSGLWFR